VAPSHGASTSAAEGWPHPGFDRYPERAASDPDWTLRDLDTSHLPYVTDPEKLAAVLLELAA
jgi:hypothetical protein